MGIRAFFYSYIPKGIRLLIASTCTLSRTPTWGSGESHGDTQSKQKGKTQLRLVGHQTYRGGDELGSPFCTYTLGTQDSATRIVLAHFCTLRFVFFFLQTLYLFCHYASSAFFFSTQFFSSTQNLIVFYFTRCDVYELMQRRTHNVHTFTISQVGVLRYLFPHHLTSTSSGIAYKLFNFCADM